MKLIDELKNLIDSYEELERKLDFARFHIKRKIRCFSPEELECMWLDGILEPEDIPEDLRTDYVKKWAFTLNNVCASASVTLNNVRVPAYNHEQNPVKGKGDD
jgi:hypothetical protein